MFLFLLVLYLFLFLFGLFLESAVSLFLIWFFRCFFHLFCFCRVFFWDISLVVFSFKEFIISFFVFSISSGLEICKFWIFFISFWGIRFDMEDDIVEISSENCFLVVSIFWFRVLNVSLTSFSFWSIFSFISLYISISGNIFWIISLLSSGLSVFNSAANCPWGNTTDFENSL